MPVLIDDQPVELQGDTLGLLLASAQQHLETSDRIIVEVLVEGDAVIGEDISTRQNESIGDKDVRMVTAEPRVLASSALYQIRDLLGQADACIEKAADLLQQDKFVEAMQLIAQAIEIWQKTPPGIVQSAQLTGIEPESLQVGDTDFTGLTNTLVDKLRQLRDLLESRDTVALADMLAYEMPDAMGQWSKLIDVILDQMESPPDSTPTT